MSGITRVNCEQKNYFNPLESELKEITSNEEPEKPLQQALEGLALKKQDLLREKERIQQLLNEVEKQECDIKSQIAQIQAPCPVQSKGSPEPAIESAKKVAAFVGPAIVVNTAQIIKSRDGTGEREHYKVSLITSENETMEIVKWPIDTNKYGEAKQIVILDGENETVLKSDENPVAARLIKYFSTEFSVFRKEINKKHVDINGSYPNEHQTFDCNRFAYYLRRGVEGTFPLNPRLVPMANYREGEGKHSPFSPYAIIAETLNYGIGGNYKGADLNKHYYTCLTSKVFVSKYGTTDVLFTSYQHILDAYFPAKFVKGNRWQEG